VNHIGNSTVDPGWGEEVLLVLAKDIVGLGLIGIALQSFMDLKFFVSCPHYNEYLQDKYMKTLKDGLIP
jgi:hypothetical protein